MMMINFTVVIPLYNKELSIINTLKSVLNQTYQNFEIVVIDDGSTDDSAKIVKNMNNPKIRLISQPNQGVSAARNNGVEKAKNDWIAFLDADDIWEKNHLEEVVKMMLVFPNATVYTTSFRYSDNRKVFKHKRAENVFVVSNYFQEALLEDLICTNIIVVNRISFNKVGGFKTFLNRGEDVDLWARLAKRFDIVKSTTVTAIYRIDAENRTSLSRNLEKTHVYHLNLNTTNQDEKAYYEHLIFLRLLAYLRSGDLQSFLKLFIHHKQIKRGNFLRFVANHYKGKGLV